MADNEWTQPDAPPPPLFLGKKERDFVKQVNDELIERIIGQGIFYYPISMEHTNFHPLYGEAIEKTFLVTNFCDKCLKGIKPNLRNIKEGVENSLMLVTALAPEIGYEKAAELAKLAHKKNITLIEANKILNYIDVRKMKSLLNPSKMISSS